MKMRYTAKSIVLLVISNVFGKAVFLTKMITVNKFELERKKLRNKSWTQFIYFSTNYLLTKRHRYAEYHFVVFDLSFTVGDEKVFVKRNGSLSVCFRRHL